MTFYAWSSGVPAVIVTALELAAEVRLDLMALLSPVC